MTPDFSRFPVSFGRQMIFCVPSLVGLYRRFGLHPARRNIPQLSMKRSRAMLSAVTISSSPRSSIRSAG